MWYFFLRLLASDTMSCTLISHIYPPLLQFPHSESVTLFCFLLLLLSHSNSTRTTSSPLPFTQNICTCIHTHMHTHTCVHTHTRYTHLSPPPHEPPIIHTHSVSVGVVPDRNKWQLPNYLLTVDVDAAWDALLIFFVLSLSHSPTFLFLFLPTHLLCYLSCGELCMSRNSQFAFIPALLRPTTYMFPSSVLLFPLSTQYFPSLISCVVENDTLII